MIRVRNVYGFSIHILCPLPSSLSTFFSIALTFSLRLSFFRHVSPFISGYLWLWAVITCDSLSFFLCLVRSFSICRINQSKKASEASGPKSSHQLLKPRIFPIPSVDIYLYCCRCCWKTKCEIFIISSHDVLYYHCISYFSQF